MSRLVAALLLAALAAGSAGCITRSVRQPVFDDGYTEVLLRSEKRGTRVVEKGFDQPVAVAPVRIAHVLSRVDLRQEDGAERVPAVPLETLFTIADGVAQALGEADSNQEVVVQSIRRDRHWGVFDRQYLTSFVAYMRNDQLFLHFSRSDWEIPKQRKGKIPEPRVDDHPLGFRLVPDVAMTLVGEQSVAVDWQDKIFSRPTRTRVTPGGRVLRRTILMESPEDESQVAQEPGLPSNLSPAQLRDLADLEESRREGGLTEAEYRKRQQQIVDGVGAGTE